MYYFQDIESFYVFDEKLVLIDKCKKGKEKELIKKYKPDKIKEYWQYDKVLDKIAKKDLKEVRNFCISETKKKLQKAVNEDMLIIQTINNIDEIDKTVNLHSKRLREWFSLYFPELNIQITNNEIFVSDIINNTREELIKKLKIEETVGSDLEKEDVEEMKKLAETIKKLIELKESHLLYLRSIMQKYCPNLVEIAGPSIAAKLIAQAGSLKNLAELPSSTLQLLGAEKALFRHLKKHTKPPKYGIIFNHPFVANSKEKGKAARALAAALSIASKVDLFKGEYIAPKLKINLDKKNI